MRSAIGVLLAAVSLLLGGCYRGDPAKPDAGSRPSGSPARGVHAPSSPQPAGAGAKSMRSRPASTPKEAYLTAGYVPRPQDFDLPSIVRPEITAHAASNPSLITESGNYEDALPSNPFTRSPLRTGEQDIASVVFNSPFQALFASLFNRRDKDLNRDALAAKEDLPNPFTKPRSESAAAAVPTPPTATVAQTPQPQASSAQQDSSPNPQSGIPETIAAGSRQSRVTFLGDFDGTGSIRYAYASRTGNATYSFVDGLRTFVILNNQSAVENQRGFAVDDMNGDGQVDILQTGRAGLFGAVILGDGSGNFQYSGYFLTGYEPVVALPGPMEADGREVMTVDTRNGLVTMFHTGGIYVPFYQTALPFQPDHLAHIAGRGDGFDYLLAAQAGAAPHLYRLDAGGSLTESSQDLPAGPSISINGDPLRDNGMASLVVYQVGSYASVVLSDNQGRAFNVANVRVTPRLFLAIGDLEGHGSLDVGIACLLSAVLQK